ncbi:MAG TPA: dipeptide/oligopeptide/nickel ABC transporter permease/ATP-binding protein, partial [Sphingomicrobium sp.]|nr:dipeptide/oligopeptide/nickel ABC transporter permease/ATP-binding protein [Sphingomicrobium sp.]
VGILGPGLQNAGVVVAVALVPGFVRLIRGQALAVREEVFVDASRALGSRAGRIVWRHLLPNVASPLIVQASVVAGFVILFEASLSFLGLGAQPPTASWGSMLNDAYQNLLVHPWQAAPPGIAIALTVLAFNLAGDALRSAIGFTVTTHRQDQLGLTTVNRPQDPDRAAASSRFKDDALLVVQDLSMDVMTPNGRVRILDNISFSISPGETVGLVGESGSGKSVTSLSIMRLLPSPPAQITGGTILFEGKDLLSLPFKEIAGLRGSKIAMIFQDPMVALNPSMSIARQISQVVRWHEGTSSKVARERMFESLEMVGISRTRADSYPHEFSGGMRQRAMIAMALVCRPKLLIADEPTTALDVTIQAQVLELLHEMRRDLGLSILFVTHDLGVVADICDRVMVMYAGQIVETASAEDLFARPSHPYTEGLLRAMPQRAAPRTTLYAIPGQVPQFSEIGGGCRLAARCQYVQERCREADVALTEAAPGHLARCARVNELSLVTRP